MVTNRKGMWWQFLIAFLLHASVLLFLIKWDDDPQKLEIRGIAGALHKKDGSADAIEAPIKISLQTGGVADARQIIASRKQAEQQAQAEQARLEAIRKQQEAKQIADEKARIAAQEQKQLQQQLERQKELAAKQAKQLEGQVTDKEQDKKLASTNNPSPVNQQQQKPNKDTTTQNATQASKAQQAAPNRRQQDAQRKATTQAQQDSQAINAALKDITGEGGGDGVTQNTPDADPFERYKAKVQSEVNANFIFNPAYMGQDCRIEVNIAPDGRLTIYQNQQVGTAGVCALGMQAIVKTQKVTAPPPSIIDRVRNVTLLFSVRN
ncbi:cell envelope integrity protein TolA [Psittacicella hinzii]|uniref:Protein TolA n=1 Tax=Psittacicella hinzii TaxID=2028575 RepID=A0A3A1YHX6_9GAMM|nr:cell envelope integrity protein TolA [Psittacicella hinzii]RIY37863.1 protein TolA [Psittacicella hinzii]